MTGTVADFDTLTAHELESASLAQTASTAGPAFGPMEIFGGAP